MHPDLQTILHTEEEIQGRIAELGAEISRDYAEKNPLLICVLKGAVLFMADLVKRVESPMEMDFMATSSYGDASKSSGIVKILKDTDRPVEGRHVILVEDIVDTGLTLAHLQELMFHRRAASVKIAALFDKPARRVANVTPDYRGFTVPDQFIVGYGLDYAEHYRNLPYIGILKQEVYVR